MDGIERSVRRLVGSGLAAVSDVYEHRSDVVFRGERPGADWHFHGYFKRWLWTVVDGERVRHRLLKGRWRHKRRSQWTRHSRPPDDVAQIHFCTVVVVLCLWAWLVSVQGVEKYDDVFASLSERPSRRTVQRWAHRALPLSTTTQQLLRFAVIERGEPRPMKRLFPSGLAPPVGLDRRRWRDRSLVSGLCSGLAVVVDAAISFEVPLALLLAEARGRWTPGEPFLL